MNVTQEEITNVHTFEAQNHDSQGNAQHLRWRVRPLRANRELVAILDGAATV